MFFTVFEKQQGYWSSSEVEHRKRHMVSDSAVASAVPHISSHLWLGLC